MFRDTSIGKTNLSAQDNPHPLTPPPPLTLFRSYSGQSQPEVMRKYHWGAQSPRGRVKELSAEGWLVGSSCKHFRCRFISNICFLQELTTTGLVKIWHQPFYEIKIVWSFTDKRIWLQISCRIEETSVKLKVRPQIKHRIINLEMEGFVL